MNKDTLVTLTILIGTLTQESQQQFSVPDKNKHCTFNEFAVCLGDMHTEMDTPRRADGKEQWKHLIISFYSYISIKLSSIQVDTLHIRHSNVVKCFIDTTFTKEIQVESVRGQVNIEWFKTRVSSEITDIGVFDSPTVLMSKSPSVSECPVVGMLALTKVNVTFKFNCLNADAVSIKETTVTQDDISIQLNVNHSISMRNSIVDIRKGQSIFAINASVIQLKNTTFKTATGASVVFIADKMYVSDSNFHTTRDTLEMIGRSVNTYSVEDVVFARNNFTSSSVDILKLSSQSWTFVDNNFACTCYLKAVINESLLDEELYELNYCHLSRCRITLKAFFDTIHNSQMCNITDHDLCSNVESKQLPDLNESHLHYVVPFTVATLLIIILLAVLVCIKMYSRSSTRESLLCTNNQTLSTVKESDLSESKDSEVSYASKVKHNLNPGLPDIYCELKESKCALPDVYSKALDSVASDNLKFEQNNTQIYSDVADVLYSAVDYSKKKKKSSENKRAGVNDKSAVIDTLTKVTELLPFSPVVVNAPANDNIIKKCAQNNYYGIYSEVNKSGKNTTNIYDNPYSTVEEIVRADSKIPTDIHDNARLSFAEDHRSTRNVDNDLSTDGNYYPAYYNIEDNDEIYCSIDSCYITT